MPLTAKGQKILGNLKKEYGEKKGKQVLYAGANKGTFTGIHDDAVDPKDLAQLKALGSIFQVGSVLKHQQKKTSVDPPTPHQTTDAKKRKARDLEVVDPPTPLEYRIDLNTKDKRSRARDAFHRALDRALTGDALDPRDAALLEALVKMDKNYHREQHLPTARGESYSYDPAWKMVRNKDARRHFHHALDRVMDGPPEEMPEFIAAIRKHLAEKRASSVEPSAEKRARYFTRFETGEEPLLMRDSRRARYHAALDRLMGRSQDQSSTEYCAECWLPLNSAHTPERHQARARQVAEAKKQTDLPVAEALARIIKRDRQS